ncbi:hypothetical protein ACVGV4_08235, partial [Enterobacter hormaechei]
MKWSWPDSPGGAARAPAYRVCRPGNRTATRQKHRAVSKFLPVRRLAQIGIFTFLEKKTPQKTVSYKKKPPHHTQAVISVGRVLLQKRGGG